jgi:hypothetical protein
MTKASYVTRERCPLVRKGVGQLTIGVALEMIDGPGAMERRRRRGKPVQDPSDQEVRWRVTRRAADGAGTAATVRRQLTAGRTPLHGRSKPMNTGRSKRIKSRLRRRNPVARTLRDPSFRARREANRRRYSRKLKHKQEPQSDDG